MIQEAHVGVGIRGEEGLQAVNASDYAIAQFRFLQVLLLKHGRRNYHRMSNLVCYMFYKNVLMSSCSFWFSWLNGFSGQKMFNEGSIQFYNLFYTALPILLYGVLDWDLSSKIAYRYPQLYAVGINNGLFNVSHLLSYCRAVCFSSVREYDNACLCSRRPFGFGYSRACAKR
jgi:magnesium-transporting ATPase (P-type)